MVGRNVTFVGPEEMDTVPGQLTAKLLSRIRQKFVESFGRRATRKRDGKEVVSCNCELALGEDQLSCLLSKLGGVPKYFDC